MACYSNKPILPVLPVLPYNPTNPENLTIGEDGVIRFACKEETPTNTTPQILTSIHQPPTWDPAQLRPASRNEQVRSKVVAALHHEDANKPILPYNPTDPNNLAIGEDGLIRFAHEELVSLTDDSPQSSSPSHHSSPSTTSISRPASRSEELFPNVALALQEERDNKSLLSFNHINLDDLIIDEGEIIHFPFVEEPSPIGTVFDLDDTSTANHNSDTSLLSSVEEKSTDDKSQEEIQICESSISQAKLHNTTTISEQDNEDVLASLKVDPIDDTDESFEEYIDSTESMALEQVSTPQVIQQDLVLHSSNNIPKPVTHIYHILDDSVVSVVQLLVPSVELDQDKLDEDDHFQQLINNMRSTAPENANTSFLDEPFEYRESLLQDLQELKKTSTWHARTDIFMDPAVILVGKPQFVEKWDNNENREATAAHFAQLLNGLHHSAAKDECLVLTTSQTAIEANSDELLQEFEIDAFNDSSSILCPVDEATMTIPRAQSPDHATVSDAEKYIAQLSQSVDESRVDEDCVAEKPHLADHLLGPKQNDTPQESSTPSPSKELHTTAPQSQSFHETTTFNTEQNVVKEEPMVKARNEGNSPTNNSRFAAFLDELEHDAANDKPLESSTSNETVIAMTQVHPSVKTTILTTETSIKEPRSVESANDEDLAEPKSKFANLFVELKLSSTNNNHSLSDSSETMPPAVVEGRSLDESTSTAAQDIPEPEVAKKQHSTEDRADEKAHFSELLCRLRSSATDKTPIGLLFNNETPVISAQEQSSNTSTMSAEEQEMADIKSLLSAGSMEESQLQPDSQPSKIPPETTTNSVPIEKAIKQYLSQLRVSNEEFERQTFGRYQERSPSLSSTTSSTASSTETPNTPRLQTTSLMDIFFDVASSISPELPDNPISLEARQKDLSMFTPVWTLEEDFECPLFGYSIRHAHNLKPTSQSQTTPLKPAPAPEELTEQFTNEVPVSFEDESADEYTWSPLSDDSSKFRVFSPEPPINSPPLLRHQPKRSNSQNKISLFNSSSFNHLSKEKKTGAGSNLDENSTSDLPSAAEQSQPEASSSASSTPFELAIRAVQESLARAKTISAPLISSRRSSTTTSFSTPQPRSRPQSASSSRLSATSSLGTTPHYAQHTLSSQAKTTDSPRLQHPRVADLKGSRRSKSPSSPTSD